MATWNRNFGRDAIACVALVALTLLAYARYARAPGSPRYLVVLVLLAAGLMAKPMLVTWPILLLLLDYWPLERLKAARERP